MRKLLDIQRCASAGSQPYHQVFEYVTDDENAAVATALRELNKREHLEDVDGNPVEPIFWESSCLQKKCGACAMLINGVPRVACDARLSSLKGDVVRLAPLAKFPLVKDLVVDRDSIFERLRYLQAWHDGQVDLPVKRSEIAYEGSRCLQCGCCLEACPNFHAEGYFGGMATMVPFARLIVEAEKADRARLAKAHREAVFGGCGKSLVCRDICPAGIPLDKLMSRSNAAAIWGRY